MFKLTVHQIINSVLLLCLLLNLLSKRKLKVFSLSQFLIEIFIINFKDVNIFRNLMTLTDRQHTWKQIVVDTHTFPSTRKYE